MSYSRPVLGASGVILDIDVNESYTVTAYNSLNSPIRSITLSAGMPGTGDGVATPWSFSDSAADIASVQILPFTPTPPSIGFAYDNFATIVPEPSTLALVGVGIIGLLVYGWGRRRQKLLASVAIVIAPALARAADAGRIVVRRSRLGQFLVRGLR